jgi:hypothetical protein
MFAYSQQCREQKNGKVKKEMKTIMKERKNKKVVGTLVSVFGRPLF